MDQMFVPYRKYATFEGRAGRAEYWQFLLFVIAVEIVLQIIGAAGGPLKMLAMLALAVFGLATLIPGLAVGFRRLHDIDKSAWWMLIGLIPFIGGLVLLVFAVLDGTPGPNRFGPDPKGRESEAPPAATPA